MPDGKGAAARARAAFSPEAMKMAKAKATALLSSEAIMTVRAKARAIVSRRSASNGSLEGSPMPSKRKPETQVMENDAQPESAATERSSSRRVTFDPSHGAATDRGSRRSVSKGTELPTRQGSWRAKLGELAETSRRSAGDLSFRTAATRAKDALRETPDAIRAATSKAKVATTHQITHRTVDAVRSSMARAASARHFESKIAPDAGRAALSKAVSAMRARNAKSARVAAAEAMKVGAARASRAVREQVLEMQQAALGAFSAALPPTKAARIVEYAAAALKLPKGAFSDLSAWDAFPWRAHIPPEMRGISIRQLGSIVDHAARRLHGGEAWFSMRAPDEYSRPRIITHSSIHTVDTYDIRKYVVQPATQEDACSLVELMATSAQSATYLVSSWWGEPLLEFLAALRVHAEDHFLGTGDDGSLIDESVPQYWICAYALSSGELAAEGAGTPMQSAWMRTMTLTTTKGTVTITGSSAASFSRVWCLCEAYQSLTAEQMIERDAEYRYEIYTSACHSSRQADGSMRERLAVGVVDGCAPCDGGSLMKKQLREMCLPSEAFDAILSIQLTSASSTDDADYHRLLNHLAGTPTDESEESAATPAPAEHAMYEVLERTIVAWVVHGRLFDAIARDHFYGTHSRLDRCIAVLSSGGLRRLHLNLELNNGDSQSVVDRLVSGLQPRGFEELRLVTKAAKRLPDELGNLTDLRMLNLDGSSSLVALPETVDGCKRLETLQLKGCASLVGLPLSIPACVQLCHVDLTGCTRLAAWPAGVFWPHLRTLKLGGCPFSVPQGFAFRKGLIITGTAGPRVIEPVSKSSVAQAVATEEAREQERARHVDALVERRAVQMNTKVVEAAHEAARRAKEEAETVRKQMEEMRAELESFRESNREKEQAARRDAELALAREQADQFAAEMAQYGASSAEDLERLKHEEAELWS